MKQDAVFVYSDQLLSYKFGEDHPFNQLRVELTYDLLRRMNALEDSQLLVPRMATDEELLLSHDQSLIDAVKRAGAGELSALKAYPFGIGTGDTPMFPNMHEASALLVGATLTATDAVLSGQAKHALSLGGGLHHGFRNQASGFCVYNDCAVAIQYIRKHYNLRVLYVDTDVHHGDGVQAAFYDDPNVCTFSIHETGRYLFPGTGDVNERGEGLGYGYSFNIPVDAYTEDESWLACYQEALTEITEHFKPDIILTQNGVDSHAWDPLSHLSATMKIYHEIPKLAHELAHEYCEGRWIAVGGGGYDMWRVVPRAWAAIWLEMTERSGVEGPLPQEWVERWQPQSPVDLNLEWMDRPDIYAPIPRKQEISEKNQQTLNKCLAPIRNERMKHSF